ncbi:MAG: CoA-binding protein [Bacteroidetes bacterium GWA2_30_7]|nr:MAG: CoA-binding protein [Bacteroidetes bacterium GWA2_30_7]
MKKTLVLGASPDSFRQSYKAVKKLLKEKYEVIAFGIRVGKIMELDIETVRKHFENIHTVSIYLAPEKQLDYYDYILSLKPKRIIFNPSTYNVEFAELAKEKGVEVLESCTLIMLSAEEY